MLQVGIDDIDAAYLAGRHPGHVPSQRACEQLLNSCDIVRGIKMPVATVSLGNRRKLLELVHLRFSVQLPPCDTWESRGAGMRQGKDLAERRAQYFRRSCDVGHVPPRIFHHHRGAVDSISNLEVSIPSTPNKVIALRALTNR